MKSVCVVGLGYIGLPTSAMLASAGLEVRGVDIDRRAVDAVNSGETHIGEPGLATVVKEAVARGLLTASLEPGEADAFVIAVPTPVQDDHTPDLSHIEAASRAIAAVLRPGNLVVLESTSPVGTTERLAGWLSEERPDLTFPVRGGESATDVAVAYCPERVLPGRIIEEIVANSRLLGGIDAHSAALSKQLYATFVEGELRVCDVRSAEMAKLAENSFRDVNIAFANELAELATSSDVDIWELIELASLHPRVDILKPGAGVGGHCIAVDPWFLIAGSDVATPLLRASRSVNDRKPSTVARDIMREADRVAGRTIACLGLAYKPDVGDVRESPSIQVAIELVRHGYEVIVADPNVAELPPALHHDGVRMGDTDEALAVADVVTVLVGHREYSDVEFIQQLARFNVIDPAGVVRRARNADGARARPGDNGNAP